MSDVLPTIIPLALALSFAPIIITLSAVKLAQPNGIVRAIANVAGQATAVVLLMLLGWGIVLSAGSLPTGRTGSSSVGAWIQMIFGVLLLVLAVGFIVPRVLRRASTLPLTAPTEQSQASAPLGRSFVVSFLITGTSLRAFIWTGSAVAEVFRANLGFAGALAVCLIFLAIVLIPSSLPIVVYLAAPQTAQQMLTPAHRWLSRYGLILILLLTMATGLSLLIKGFPVIMSGAAYAPSCCWLLREPPSYRPNPLT